MQKEIKRGYVKWTDENGVFHKEPLADHPELLEEASAEQQLVAEEVRRLNAAAERTVEEREEENEQDTFDALHALQGAPEEVLTVAELTDEAPASGSEEPVSAGKTVEDFKAGSPVEKTEEHNA